MKRYIVLALALTILATPAFAGFPKINTGSSTMNKIVNKGVSGAKNKAIADDINKKIKSFNCRFKNDTTTTDTTCNLQKVVDTINKKKSTLETFGLAKVYVYIKAHGSSKTRYKRSQHVRNYLYGQMNWWRYSVSSIADNTNDLEIWVQVRD